MAAEFFDQTLKFTLRNQGAEEFITATPFENLQVLPSSPRLEEMLGKLESRYKLYKLRDAVAALEGYDRIYIDTPPALNFYTRSALIAAQGLLVRLLDLHAGAQVGLQHRQAFVDQLPRQPAAAPGAEIGRASCRERV